MSEKLPVHKIRRLKTGVFDRKKGFFVYFPRGKVILLKETEKAYLVREQLTKGYYSIDFSINSRWIPKWGIKLKERIGWNTPHNHRITYDKLEIMKGIKLMKELEKGR